MNKLTIGIFILALLSAVCLWVATRALQAEIAAREALGSGEATGMQDIVPRVNTLTGDSTCPPGFHIWDSDPALCERDGTSAAVGPPQEMGRAAPCTTDNGQECVVCDVQGEHWVELGGICHQDPKERVWQ